MKLAGLALLFLSLAPLAAVEYPLTEDSKPKDGVPKGEVLKRTLAESKIFPGTTRSVSIYVPKQYDPAKPACVWVNQDGIQHHAPVVFDNLIAKGEMPVTIYVAASPGVVKALDGKAALDRFNRSLEYDGLGDAYARFVLEELLPFVEAQKTADGRAIVLSKKGNDRCIGGSSSGAVCAFTAAWEKPQEFRRVFSTIGTYVGLRGADVYPTLIRKVEPKPLRVFLQDGSNDQNIYGGDWWMANQMMERALTWAGYEVEHAWGEEGHNAKQGDAIFPDAVRWIWKDWPREPKAGMPKNGMLPEMLLPGEGWEVVEKSREVLAKPKKEGADGGKQNAKPGLYVLTSDLQGLLTFGNGGRDGRMAPDGKVVFQEPPAATTNGRAIAYAADGTTHEMRTESKPQKDGTTEMATREMVVRADGGMFVAQSSVTPGVVRSTLTFLKPNRETVGGVAWEGTISGLALSPDQSLLYVSDLTANLITSYQVQGDGDLKHPQRYFHLHTADENGSAQAGGMAVDRDGRLYVATGMGIQICDQAGRVNAILPVPGGRVHRVCFGGPEFDTLYALGEHELYRRKLNIKGAPAFQPPVKPKAPRL